uniref:Peroxiredoxin 6 n=1 Tax=Mus musculus TaxID=10090 RepID=A0A0A6YXQ7_MOUSE
MPGGLLLGDEAPNFEANTTIGRIRFHDFLGDSTSMLTMVKHPRKSCHFPSLMIRAGTLPSFWACWIQSRRTLTTCL